MLRVIISSILAVIAIFIGFFPHSNNHTLMSIFKIKQTPGWEFNLILGNIFFCLAVFISQKKDFNFISSFALFDTTNTIKEPQSQ